MENWGWETPSDISISIIYQPVLHRNIRIPCAQGFEMLDNAIYNGTEDPSYHLVSFQEKMMVIGAEDPMYCCTFFLNGRRGDITMVPIPTTTVYRFLRNPG